MKFGKPETCLRFPIWWKNVCKSITNGGKKNQNQKQTNKKKWKKEKQTSKTNKQKFLKTITWQETYIFAIIDIHLLARYNWLKY